MKLDPELERMESANPDKDLAEALENGDRRFVGVYSIGISVPSLGNKYVPRDLANLYGIKPIKGTGDCRRSAREHELNIKARKYAQKYNDALIDALGLDI